jgi:threonyl-tRNA synthetase
LLTRALTQDKDGENKRPIMVHRAIFGSVERFFGILLENCAGEFPVWLAPTQLKVLPVSPTDDIVDYCYEIKKAAEKRGIRVEIDVSNDRLPKQVRNAEKSKVPLMAVIGQSEVDKRQITIRSKQLGDLGSFGLEEFCDQLAGRVADADEFVDVGFKEVKEDAAETAN